jgi:hypothetical protein
MLAGNNDIGMSSGCRLAGREDAGENCRMRDG